MGFFKKKQSQNEIINNECELIINKQKELLDKYLHSREKIPNTKYQYNTLYLVLTNLKGQKGVLSQEAIVTLINDLDCLVINNLSLYMNKMNESIIQDTQNESDIVVCQMLYSNQIDLLNELKKMVYFDQSEQNVRNKTVELMLEIIAFTEASLETMIHNKEKKEYYSWKRYVQSQMTTYSYFIERTKELLKNAPKYEYTYIDGSEVDVSNKASILNTNQERLFRILQKELNSK